ncbi:hypothetical protein SNEBB_007095 [Seison nebaliae]|nr:hypothetical protein SNEBB_007095 [Seison nebaliae]
MIFNQMTMNAKKEDERKKNLKKKKEADKKRKDKMQQKQFDEMQNALKLEELDSVIPPPQYDEIFSDSSDTFETTTESKSNELTTQQNESSMRSESKEKRNG